MAFIHKKIGKQGTWCKALFTFFLPIFLIFSSRWLLYEPFVIPSESMMPNLLVHDHIVVKKHAYGIKYPIGDGWLVKFSGPKRGEIIVFRYPENRDVFFIKRLVGIPGDKIIVENGRVSVNGEKQNLYPLDEEIYNDEEDFQYFTEFNIPGDRSEDSSHTVRFFAKTSSSDDEPDRKEFEVPANSYFVMGDNRDQSHDSRYWGFVPESLLVGKATMIWLSCEDTMQTAPMICDPMKLRKDRIFKRIDDL